MSTKETAEAILIVLRRIGKWIAIAALTVVLAFLVLYLYSEVADYYRNRPEVLRSLKGIDLDQKFQDFMFRNAGFTPDIKSDKKEWGVSFFENKDGSITVAIKENRVVRIIYGCAEKFEYTSVNGISCRSSGDSVLEKYKNEIRVQCLKDKDDKDFLNYRVYDAIKFGIRYHILSNTVVAFDVASQAEIENKNGFINARWTACP